MLNTIHYHKDDKLFGQIITLWTDELIYELKKPLKKL